MLPFSEFPLATHDLVAAILPIADRYAVMYTICNHLRSIHTVRFCPYISAVPNRENSPQGRNWDCRWGVIRGSGFRFLKCIEVWECNGKLIVVTISLVSSLLGGVTLSVSCSIVSRIRPVLRDSVRTTILLLWSFATYQRDIRKTYIKQQLQAICLFDALRWHFHRQILINMRNISNFSCPISSLVAPKGLIRSDVSMLRPITRHFSDPL